MSAVKPERSRKSGESRASKFASFDRADSTVQLLEKARAGEQTALNLIFERYLPPLKRWARGRLPIRARSLLDTDDLVQETVLNVLRHVPEFEYRHESALHCYLRRALKNRIRDELRRTQARPSETTAGAENLRGNETPLTLLIGREMTDEYERALKRLRPKEREFLLARIEVGMSYLEIAAAFGKSSPDAARMAVVRALTRLAEEMAR